MFIVSYLADLFNFQKSLQCNQNLSSPALIFLGFNISLLLNIGKMSILEKQTACMEALDDVRSLSSRQLDGVVQCGAPR